METVYFKGIECHTYGNIPRPGENAPCFKLTDKDLKEICCKDFEGKRIVFNIFPSIDTPVCASSVRRFNEEAASFNDTVVICVSMDLPFAAQRFCVANGIENVIVASAFNSVDFAKNYGVLITDGPLKGLLTRAVIVTDKDHKVVFTDLVEYIANEPDYQAAIGMLK